MSDLLWFDVTVPLIRRDRDGGEERQDVKLHIPAGDLNVARGAAEDIAWSIVSSLPGEGDNNRYGWKIASCGVAVEPVEVAR